MLKRPTKAEADSAEEDGTNLEGMSGPVKRPGEHRTGDQGDRSDEQGVLRQRGATNIHTAKSTGLSRERLPTVRQSGAKTGAGKSIVAGVRAA